MNSQKVLIFYKQNVYNYLTLIIGMIEQIFSKSNTKILKELIKKEYSVRDLAKQTNLSPAKISQFTKFFEKKNIIKTKKEKNTKKINLNTKNPLTRQILSTILFEQIINSKAIQKLFKKTSYIGIYGSTTTGNVDSKSDIDLFAITKTKIDSLQKNLWKKEIENELEKEVDLKLFTKKEFLELKKEDSIFYQELNNSKTIWGEK
jgi:predicted nucleotidyltransferase/Trp operon repressor